MIIDKYNTKTCFWILETVSNFLLQESFNNPNSRCYQIKSISVTPEFSLWPTKHYVEYIGIFIKKKKQKWILNLLNKLNL